MTSAPNKPISNKQLKNSRTHAYIFTVAQEAMKNSVAVIYD